MFSTQPLFCLENIGMFWMLSVYCKRTLLFRFEPILFLLVYSIHVGLFDNDVMLSFIVQSVLIAPYLSPQIV
jgi:hypothetical protein